MDHASVQVMYPRLLRRVRAFLIDSVVFIVLLYSWMVSLPAFGELPFAIKIGALAAAIMVLEPGLVAFTGGTLGHHLMGLRIRDASRDQNIGILRAIARAIIRTLLGWLSFIFVLVTKKHQALHDYFTSTVVVLRRPQSVPAHEKFVERTEDPILYVYPSKLRRMLMILLYGVLATVAVAVLSAVLLSDGCLSDSRCGSRDAIVSQVLSILWLASIGTTTVLAWRGRLFGSRRSIRAPVATLLDAQQPVPPEP
jgi:uncharacterized RDD family membrane protein YckC